MRRPMHIRRPCPNGRLLYIRCPSLCSSSSHRSGMKFLWSGNSFSSCPMAQRLITTSSCKVNPFKTTIVHSQVITHPGRYVVSSDISIALHDAADDKRGRIQTKGLFQGSFDQRQ
ncbi:hypothetical protein RvY_09003-1 [Ramazzottius varieornatus]|uniref:Uncharacterized protein n=1 Tax=Ramazzottius varieornatus TaxID=947166 RepID=A0A1D1VAB9_RAMVA|nr:hypothetical protein RvY_09003-1 [Ramazzottius varieornatus]